MANPEGDADSIRRNIEMMNRAYATLTSTEDKVLYESIIRSLQMQLAEVEQEQVQAIAGPSGTHRMPTPPWNPQTAMYIPAASSDRKRSLGPAAIPEAKRFSGHPSPVTPGTPNSGDFEAPVVKNEQHPMLAFRPANPAAEYVDLTISDPPTPDPFPQMANAYLNGPFRQPAAPVVDLTQDGPPSPVDDVPMPGAFPQPTTALDLGERTQPADAFNQEFMGQADLAQFLFHSTAPGGGYGFNQMQPGQPQYPGYVPAQAEDPWYRQQDEEDYGDFPLTADDAAAIDSLLANIKDHGEEPNDREPTPAKMCSQLKEYQRIGLTWLLNMEKAKNKGGILADEMGLGKTVQALALMCANPSTDPLVKTTLIIAPVALMRQWEKEIQRHIHPRYAMSVHLYWGSTGKRADFQKLRRYDVVLTTFGTLVSEFKQKVRAEAMFAEREKTDPSFRRPIQSKMSLLGRDCIWYRVIIDEAHALKNRNSLQSKAAADLVARHRLLMTGTPMMNSIDELFPLLRFLRITPYTEWSRFSTDFSKPMKQPHPATRKRAMNRVQVLLRTVMLRRQKTSQVDGQVICTIPDKHTEVDNVEFNDEELDVYKALETKSQLQFNRYVRNGNISANYANMLVLILRLRQVCCHPHLIRDLSQPATDGIAETDLRQRAMELDEDVINRLKEVDSFDCPICLEADRNPTIIIPCGHTACGACVQKVIETSKQAEDGNGEEAKARCPHCRGDLQAKLITDYKHFCEVHCPEKLSPDPEDPLARSPDAIVDSSDDETEDEDDDEIDAKGNLADFVVRDDDDEDAYVQAEDSETEDELEPQARRRDGKQKARANGPAKPKKTLAQLKKESMRNKAAKKKYIRRLEKTFISSAKIDKTVELLEKIQQADPTEKTLIFSQFTSFLDLIEVPLSRKRFRYQRYDGSMKMDERADAVNKFMDDPNENVMLVSLKAGNAGLNLWKASQVIILDPFWNPFVEEQAVDRAHRMPQPREVTVHRVLVPETVEDRICMLQDKKREIIGAALDEKSSKSLTRLSLTELKYLFFGGGD